MLAGGGHGKRVLDYNQARSLLHGGNHIRQTQQPGRSFNPAGLAFRRWARKKPAKRPAKGGFGVEYALYMMDLTEVYNIGNTGKTALSPDAFEPETVTSKP